MSYEGGKDAASVYKEVIDTEFDRGAKLFSDANTEWHRGAMIAEEKDWKYVMPIMHYEERFRKKLLPIDADLIMKRSDPESVAAYDRLVDEFNADVERIRREKDFAALKSFAARGRKLVFSK